MSKFAACIVAATASLFVLEGCKDDADKTLDILKKAKKELDELSKKDHTEAQCVEIANKAQSQCDELKFRNIKVRPGQGDQEILQKILQAWFQLGSALDNCMETAEGNKSVGDADRVLDLQRTLIADLNRLD